MCARAGVCARDPNRPLNVILYEKIEKRKKLTKCKNFQDFSDLIGQLPPCTACSWALISPGCPQQHMGPRAMVQSLSLLLILIREIIKDVIEPGSQICLN